MECKHEDLADVTTFDEASVNAKALMCRECGMNFTLPVDYEKNTFNAKLDLVINHIEGLKE